METKNRNQKKLKCCGKDFDSDYKFCPLCSKPFKIQITLHNNNSNNTNVNKNNNSKTSKINSNNNNSPKTSKPKLESNKNREEPIIINSKSSTQDKPRKIIVIRKDNSNNSSNYSSSTAKLLKEYPKINQYNHDDYDFDNEEESNKIRSRIEEGNRRQNNYSNNRSNNGNGNNRDRDREDDRERERDRDRRWEDFMDLQLAKTKVLKGELVEGLVRVNPYNRTQIYITVVGMEKDVLIEGFQNQNRVIEGDKVAVQLFDKSEWKEMEEKEKVVIDDPILEEAESKNSIDTFLDDVNKNVEQQKTEENVTNENNTEGTKPETVSFLRPTGKIVCLLEELHEKEFLGYLQPNGKMEKILDGDKYALFVPFNKKIPKCFVLLKGTYTSNQRNEKKLNNNIFQIRLKDWRTNNRHPFGDLIKDFGESKDFEVEKKLLLEENSISYDDTFSEEVNKCVPDDNWTITEEDRKERRDLTNLRIVSIDPSTAKDLDDAVSIKKLKNGNYEVGVHIADVTHFVKPGNALDNEAKNRGCTIYLVERSIPMLPRILSERLCSLNVGSETFAFSVLMEVDPKDTSVVNTWYGKSIIQTCGQLSYEQAQEIIDKEGDLHQLEELKKFPKLDNSKHPFHKMVRDILLLNDLAKKMRELRFENGSLTLRDMEIRFGIDEKGRPNRWFIKDQTQSMKLIEEYMLLANKVVANKIYQHFPQNSLLRLHPAPKKERLQQMQLICRRNDIQIDTSSSKSLNSSLEKAKKTLPKLKYEALMYLTLRTMQQAKYVSTHISAEGQKKDDEKVDDRKLNTPGSRHTIEGQTKESSGYNKGSGVSSGSPFHHYALNMPIYTHFTSPIRRYPDVVVHRLLYAAINNLKAPDTLEELEQICKNSNEKKVQADDASKQSGVVFLCTFIQDRDIWTRAVVWEVSEKKIGILVPQYGVDFMINVNDLGTSSNTWDEKNGVMTLLWDDENEKQSQNNEKQSQNSENIIENNVQEKVVEKVDLLNKMELSVFSEIVVSLEVNSKRMRLSMDVKLVRDKRKIETAAKQKVIKKRSDLNN